mmetsp:Transcript_30983/g.74885  ORF Transcript_30983/g.74885 Transcript_30983/m.74885 type:complete len:99 (-) Transcript_30983:35-331(-)
MNSRALRLNRDCGDDIIPRSSSMYVPVSDLRLYMMRLSDDGTRKASTTLVFVVGNIAADAIRRKAARLPSPPVGLLMNIIYLAVECMVGIFEPIDMIL